MKILCCGSRNWEDIDLIEQEFAILPENSIIIEGGARGADRMCRAMAIKYGFDVISVPADWDKYGKAAGFRRNLQMLDMNPDLVLAFWLNNSKGTAHTIRIAKARNIPVKIITC